MFPKRELLRRWQRKRFSTSALPVSGFGGCLTVVRTQKTELNFCEAVADIFDCASLEAEPIGHHLQTAPQLFVALLHVVSNFAAFEWCNRRVGDPAPCYPLPLLQVTYLET
jgi:hypothetical protein